MTVGAVALIFLAAMQSLAVTTVMPVVSADLDGAALYAVAFAGHARDERHRHGGGRRVVRPRRVLGAAVRPRSRCSWSVSSSRGSRRSMEILVVGRLIQGLGTGGQTVALYVVVARVYPPAIHGRVFAAFSAAWVVPSLIGPFLAGAVDRVPALALGVPRRRRCSRSSRSRWSLLRLHGLPLHTDHPATGARRSRASRARSPSPSAHWRSASPASSGRGRGSWSRHPSSSSALASRPLLPPRTLRRGARAAERRADARPDRRRAVRRRDLRARTC